VVLRSRRTICWLVMALEELYVWDRDGRCNAVLGTTDSRHPLVSEMHGWGTIWHRAR